jgi:hypothetical protein
MGILLFTKTKKNVCETPTSTNIIYIVIRKHHIVIRKQPKLEKINLASSQDKFYDGINIRYFIW